MISCGVTASDGGEGFVALAPDGTRYTFTQLVYRPMADVVMPWETPVYAVPMGNVTIPPTKATLVRRDAVMYVTKVEDRFGNTLTYNWNGNNLTSIVASDGRKLSFTYVSGTPYIQTVTEEAKDTPGRTWTYNYQIYSGNIPALTSVQLPDRSAWNYQTGSLESGVLDTRGGQCQGPPAVVTTGGGSGSMTAPSGLTATFTVNATQRARSYVPLSCIHPQGTDYSWNAIPVLYDPGALIEEDLSGPGVPVVSNGCKSGASYCWKYSYSSPNPSFASDACASNQTCSATAYTDVTDPLGNTTRSTFSNRFDATEGLLLSTTEYSGSVASGTIMRSTVNTYASGTGGVWPASYGVDPQDYDNSAQVTELSPLQKRVITQDGATFTSMVNTFDSYARSTKETDSSTLGFSKTAWSAYYYDRTHWVLGQVSTTAINATAALPLCSTSNATTTSFASCTLYDSATALPLKGYAFGKLQSTKTWNSDGTLHTVADGATNTTTFSSWKREIPQLITYADNTIQSAVVNDDGWITSVTDENGNGYATGYKYDSMGRLSEIDYPTSDDVAWNKTYLTFAPYTAGGEYGIPAGHWKQTVHTGTGYKVTYFDALWRPLVTDTYDSSNISGTRSVSVNRYDAEGRNSFASYPLASVPNGNYASANTGTHSYYDALDRITEVDQDSELGLLKTITKYSSPFETVVTNPRGYAVTTDYMAFDTPTTDWPEVIETVIGELTVISRDAFGKPLSIRKSGTAVHPGFAGTMSVGPPPSLTRYYLYDANQQLCERIDPESGMTVMQYDAAGNLDWSASGLAIPATPNCNNDRTTAYNSGRRVDRGYDLRNRLSALAFPDGNGDQTWGYTPDGLPAQIDTTNSGSTVTNKYSYDRRRLMTNEQLIAPLDRQGQTSGTFTWTSFYGHDVNGHLSRFTNPKGTAIDYAPNALGQATKAASYVTGVTYFPDGKLKGYTAGNGIVYSMQENTRGLPGHMTYSGAQGQPASFDSQYTYDQNGNVTAIGDNARTNYDRTMIYDELDRLKGVNAALLGGQYNLYYDTLDNLSTFEHIGGSTSTYNYDSSNHLSTISNTVSGTTNLSWDVQGNLASKTGHTYQFDYGNRLREIPGNEIYMYDGYGRRVEQVGTTLNTIFRNYTFSGQLDFESDERNGVQQGYVYLGGQLVAIQDYTHNSVAWQTTDALGSVVAQTNSAAWVDHFNYYHIWGNLQSGSLSDGPGYAKLVYDTNTGLSYAQQRYYDPTIPSFLSVDPVDVDPNTGANFNRYAYANDNPYRYTDLDGRESACFSNNFGCGLRQETSQDQKDQLIAIAGVAAFMTGGLIGPELAGSAFTEDVLAQTSTAAARGASAAAEASGASGGATSGLATESGEVFTGASTNAGGPGVATNPSVQEALDAVDANSRSAFHGCCGEIDALSKAANAGTELRGAVMTTVRAVGRQAGNIMESCSSCRAVAERLGVRLVEPPPPPPPPPPTPLPPPSVN